MLRRKRRRVARGIVSGAIGGLAGSWMMNQFWALQSKMQQQDEQQKEERAVDNPTVKVAEGVARPLLGRELGRNEKKTAGSVVHYSFGAVMGGLYGALCESMPATSAGFGSAYAGALWLGADEVGVPALKLSPLPQETPLPQHLSGLAAHLVYGLTTESVRRLLRNAR